MSAVEAKVRTLDGDLSDTRFASGREKRSAA